MTIVAETRTLHPRIVERLYELPRPMLTHEGWVRWHHADLDAMPTEDLYRERRCILRRTDYERDPDAWFGERVRRINAEIRKRRRR